MKIAIVNDVHFGPEGFCGREIRKLSRFSECELERFIDMVAGRDDIDAVLQLGDLIEDEEYRKDARRYRTAIRRFKRLRQPVYHVIGNHDAARLAEEDLRTWLGVKRLFYSFTCREYTGLVLYSEHRNGILPRIGISQMTWLKRQLRQAPGPVVVFLHHPLDDQSLSGNPWFENNPRACLVENRREVRQALEACGKVVAVVNGHVHWHKVSIIHGIPYITLQSLVENVGGEAPAGSTAILTFEPTKLRIEVSGAQSRDEQIPMLF